MGKKYQLVTRYADYGKCVVQLIDAVCHSSKQSKGTIKKVAVA
jgi:hypothetical protein